MVLGCRSLNVRCRSLIFNLAHAMIVGINLHAGVFGLLSAGILTFGCHSMFDLLFVLLCRVCFAARRGAPGGGGRPPRGPVGGGAARRGAPWVGAPAEGPGGGRKGGDRLGSGHPQKTIQSPNRQYKAQTDNTKPLNIRHRPNILDKILKY